METAAGPAAARPPHPAPVSEPAGSVGRGARLLFPEAAGGPVRKPGRGPVANPFFPNDRKIDGGPLRAHPGVARLFGGGNVRP